jgi:multidrug efflux pump subunit AcrA (membrane-fusion protein)
LDVTRTVIRAPFDCRLGDVELQLEQFVAAGQSLFEGHGTDIAEVEAQVPLDQLRTLIDPAHGIQAPVMMNPETVKRLFNFQVLVRYRSGDFRVQWEGRVVRLREELDPRTRTIGLVVAVDKPYEQAVPGERPPLVRGMFCEVELRGGVQQEQIVVPRSALHDDVVYVVDHQRRLRRRRVSVAFAQSGFVCLQDGLQPGETLVVSDPLPAIEGLLTEPVIDDQVTARLEAEASGEANLK